MDEPPEDEWTDDGHDEDAEAEDDPAEIASRYAEHTQLALSLIATTIERQFDHLLERGLLGDDPAPSLVRAARFETGCLHLFELDHQLRRGRKEDVYLNWLWRDLAMWLLEAVSQEVDATPFRSSFGWRMEPYEEAAARVDDDDTDDTDASMREDDYLFLLARQYRLCLDVDASAGGESGLYAGIVTDDIFDGPRDPQHALECNQHMTELLFEDLLPLHYIAASWAEDGPFYEKPIADLVALTEEGWRAAGAVFEKRVRHQLDLACIARWRAYHDDERLFALTLNPAAVAPANPPRHRFLPAFLRPPVPEPSWNDRLPIVTNPSGHPLLRVSLATSGGEDAASAGGRVSGKNLPKPGAESGAYPLRTLLALAHDLGVGLLATYAPNGSGDDIEEPNADPLSFGNVVSLLRTGSAAEGYGDLPDISNWDRIVIEPPTPWQVSQTALMKLAAYYRDRDAELRSRIGAAYHGPRCSWVTDAAGISLLALAPADQAAISYMAWLVPPDLVAGGEWEPNYAQFPLDMWGDGDGTDGTKVPYNGVSAEGRSIALAADSLFVLVDQVAFGVGGEPYHMIEAALYDDQEDAHPLLDFALPCYELGRGIALRSTDGELIWRMSLGDVIGLLRSGNLPPDFIAFGEPTRRESPPQLGASDASRPPALAPDRLSLPGASQRGIARALRHAGVANPRMGLMIDQQGHPTLCFGPAPKSPVLHQWLMWQISWYLHAASGRFLLTRDRRLTPHPMP